MVTPEEVEASEIGQQFFYGDGRRMSYRKAFPYLLKAAHAGDPHCQNLVGYSYDLGLGIEKNIQLALFWYKHAAKNNDQEGLFNLALHYEKGDGGELDIRKAFSLYKRGAKLGDAAAQCNLGVMYLEGVGTKQNYAEFSVGSESESKGGMEESLRQNGYCSQ